MYHGFRLRRGQDLYEAGETYVNDHHIAAGAVVSGVGCVSRWRLRDATGVRVREVRSIPVAAARAVRTDISRKGRIRTILLPSTLGRKLLRFARQQKTASGEIFLTRSGTSLSRKQIWREMKGLCQRAGVAPTKVFPHNLRHLFARTFYQACRDVVKLADVLGHSSIGTTRIYLLSTGAEHAKVLEQLRLIS